MASVFISYSRRDQAFVRRIHETLKASQHEPWVDWEGIQPSAEWLAEIYTAIDGSDVFLYVISPDSVSSEVCTQEIDHAIKQHKRLVPLLLRDVNPKDVRKEAASHNWILCRETDSYDQAVANLIKAIETDLTWVRAHTRLLTKASEWELHHKEGSFALRGQDLARAEEWLATAGEDKEPRPTSLQTQYVLASRKSVLRRQRLVGGYIITGLALAGVLGLGIMEHAQKARYAQARELYTQSLWDLENHEIPSAEVTLAKSLTLSDSPETRERFLEAHSKDAPLDWLRPAQIGDSTLTVSPDGRFCAIRDAAHAVQVWDVGGHHKLLTLPSVQSAVVCAAFSGDGRGLATGCENGSVHLWDISPGDHYLRHVRTLPGHERAVLCAAFSPDGSLLATGGKNLDIRVWDVASGRQIQDLRGHSDQILCLAFSPDDRTLASGTRGSDIWLWDVKTGVKQRELHGHQDAVFSLAFSPDGNSLASGSWDTTIWLWDPRTGDRLRQLRGHESGVLSVAFSRSGEEVLTSGEDGTARLWDAQTGEELLTLRGQNGFLRYVALGMGETDLVAAGEDGTLRVWDIGAVGARRELLTLRGHTNFVRCVAFAPNGKDVVTGSEDLSVRVWNAATGKELRHMTGHTRGVFSIFYRADSRRFASAGKDGVVREWDPATGANTLTLRLPAACRHVEYSPTASVLATACDDSNVYLWNTVTGKLLRTLPGHTDMALCVAFSPDGKLLASGGEDHRILVWDVATGHRYADLKGHKGPVWDVVFGDNGKRLFSASEDATVGMWDMASRLTMGSLVAHDGPVWDLSWCARNRTLASAGQDGCVRLWHFDGAGALSGTRTLRACSGPMWWVDWSQDGERLAASSEDHTARIWNLGQVDTLLSARPEDLLKMAERDTGLMPLPTLSGGAD